MVLYNYCACFATSQKTISNVVNDSMIGWVDYAISASVKVLAGADSTYRSSLSGKSWVDVGFGDTPETFTDRKLADGNTQASTGDADWDPSKTRLTCVASGINEKADDEFINIYSNFRNDGNSTVVVKEVGILGNATQYHTDNTSYVSLFCRKVLDTPLSIAPGETYSFTYRLKVRN